MAYESLQERLGRMTLRRGPAKRTAAPKRKATKASSASKNMRVPGLDIAKYPINPTIGPGVSRVMVNEMTGLYTAFFNAKTEETRKRARAGILNYIRWQQPDEQECVTAAAIAFWNRKR